MRVLSEKGSFLYEDIYGYDKKEFLKLFEFA
jgi:hypothetical protein